MRDPLSLIHQAAVHQLDHAAGDIEDGNGIVVDFDYDEETDEYQEEMRSGMPLARSTERTVTLELTYILPE